VLGPDTRCGALQRPAEAGIPTYKSPSRWGLTFFAMTSNAVNSLRFRPKTAFSKKTVKNPRGTAADQERPMHQRVCSTASNDMRDVGNVRK
jgi:hypothetical protein